ncbi:MAG: CvpA family protein, partial [Rickettsiales bacterium]
MIDAQLNYLDMAVIAIMLLSAIFAFFRGFVREILSLVAWIGAAYITIQFFPSFSESLQPHFKEDKTAAGCAILVLYIGSLIGFAIINRFIIKILKSGSGVGWVDNMLGLVFGTLRGAFIISLGFFIISVAIPENIHPQWFIDAKTRPYAEEGALILAKIAPDYMKELSSLQKKANIDTQDSITIDTEKPI